MGKSGLSLTGTVAFIGGEKKKKKTQVSCQIQVTHQTYEESSPAMYVGCVMVDNCLNVRGLCGVSFMMAVLSHPLGGGGRGSGGEKT